MACKHLCHKLDTGKFQVVGVGRLEAGRVAVAGLPEGYEGADLEIVSCKGCWEQHDQPSLPKGIMPTWETSITSNLPLIGISGVEYQVRAKIKAEA